MNSADRIHRALVSRHADLNRYASGLSRKTLAMLDKLGKGLARDLMDAGLDATRTDWQRARLRSLLKAVQERTGKAYAEIAEMHASEMSGLVEVSGAHITTAINGALGAGLLIPPKWTAEQLAAIASDVLVDGAPSAEWWSRQADGLTRAFADQMRQGMLRGENVAQLRDRILGQNLPGIGAVGKVDLRTVQPAARGLIQTARRNAEGLVRSSVISTANAAHLAAYQANSDIMEGMEWCATLDMRTCPRCAALDGKRWTLDGEPLGHGIAFPGPALHWADRCTQLPVTKSWETLARENGGNTRLARELDAMDASTRASMDGQVSSKLTYEGWFAEQSAERQEDILGPARYALYKRGKLSFGDLVDGRGNPLTLEELSKKY